MVLIKIALSPELWHFHDEFLNSFPGVTLLDRSLFVFPSFFHSEISKPKAKPLSGPVHYFSAFISIKPKTLEWKILKSLGD